VGPGHAAADRGGADLRRYEFTDQIDPFEAGISFTVALKGMKFIGREAVLRQEHPRYQLVGLELNGNETAGRAIASMPAAPRWARSPAPPVPLS
jgi:glycine cleavage system aminomethyltransferase T